MPTPLYGLPLYGDDDTAELDALLNGQSTAIEAALSSQFVDHAGMSVATFADLPSSGNWAGRQLLVRATGIVYIWNGTWIASDTGDIAVSLNGGWTNFTGTASYRVRSGMASLNGRINAGSGATTVAFTLPAIARPSTERVASVMLAAGNTYQTLIIGTDGKVTFFNLSLPASDYRLASIPPWPVA